jgi:hypothetical protein
MERRISFPSPLSWRISCERSCPSYLRVRWRPVRPGHGHSIIHRNPSRVFFRLWIRWGARRSIFLRPTSEVSGLAVTLTIYWTVVSSCLRPPRAAHPLLNTLQSCNGSLAVIHANHFPWDWALGLSLCICKRRFYVNPRSLDHRYAPDLSENVVCCISGCNQESCLLYANLDDGSDASYCTLENNWDSRLGLRLLQYDAIK